jgi:microcin C transport system ATP-binding protein
MKDKIVLMPQKAPSDDLLVINGLGVDFINAERRVTAVKDVSLRLGKGETLALVGESGSGKSITALSILQLLPYAVGCEMTGSIRFAGREMIGAPEREMERIRGNKIAMVFQEPMTSLNPLQTLEKQIGEVLALHKGLRGRDARNRSWS